MSLIQERRQWPAYSKGWPEKRLGDQYCDYGIKLVGAGRVGLTVAFRLLELGLRVLVAEKRVDLPYRVASYP